MRIVRWIRLALKWYLDAWIQVFLHAADTGCSMLGPEEILKQDGLEWDPELKKYRRAKSYESTAKEMQNAAL